MSPTVAEFLASEHPVEFSHDFDGSCICCEINGLDFNLFAHCWRSGCNKTCEFSGCHISGNISKEDKIRIAEHFIDKSNWKYSTDWNIVYDS